MVIIGLKGDLNGEQRREGGRKREKDGGREGRCLDDASKVKCVHGAEKGGGLLLGRVGHRKREIFGGQDCSY